MNRQPNPSLPDEVWRVMVRDDLLTMAEAAEDAVGIVRERESLARRTQDEKSLFAVALEHHLAIAEGRKRPRSKAQAWDYAAVIVRFGKMVDLPVRCDYTPEQMHANAVRELAGKGLLPPVDLMLDVVHRYHAARDLRMIGEFDRATELVDVDKERMYASGAEPHLAHYLYETGAAYLAQGQAATAYGELQELDEYWRTNQRAAGFPTRYRYEFVRALARWADRPDDPAVLGHLRQALKRVAAPGNRRDSPLGEFDLDHDVQELSLTLAKAEYLVSRGLSDERTRGVVDLGRRALDLADDVRGRWRVIARSRAPLAVVFQRVYGDIALLAARLPGPEAAELGLRIALSAKQTGFAARMRAGRRLMNTTVEGLISDIVAIENKPRDAIVGADNDSRDEELSHLRFRLAEEVSPMLADTILPTPADLDQLTGTLGARFALDFVELDDTLGTKPHLFRTLIRPGGGLSFGSCDPGLLDRAYFEEHRANAGLARDLKRRSEQAARELLPEGPRPDRDWRGLAAQVLPAELVAELTAPSDEPVQLLISAHSWLSLVPWAALTIDARGTRLVERAVITQCPVLTCLQNKEPAPVRGTALIRLVGRDEESRAVSVGRERQSWSLPDTTDGVPLSECEIVPEVRPVVRGGTLADALAEADRWQFMHIACHGGGTGLGQYLRIPGDTVSAGQALSLKWPAAVLMASCYVGQVVNNAETEPLNFVTALLTGGARCVVAGIDSVDDIGTGKAANHIVQAIRAGHLPLEVALRNAQLSAIEERLPYEAWALLSAYVK